MHEEEKVYVVCIQGTRHNDFLYVFRNELDAYKAKAKYEEDYATACVVFEELLK